MVTVSEVSMYNIGGVTMRLKLEPLTDLVCGHVYGFEILSYPVDSNVDVEKIFEHASPLELWRVLDIQFSELRAFAAVDFSHKMFFVNIDVRFFSIPGFSKIFLEKTEGISISLELSKPIKKDAIQGVNYNELKRAGVEFWLDDYNGSTENLDFNWDGIKLDKYFFWRYRDGDSSISDYCDFMRVIFGERLKLLSEGVESNSDLMKSLALKIPMGQGYKFNTIYL